MVANELLSCAKQSTANSCLCLSESLQSTTSSGRESCSKFGIQFYLVDFYTTYIQYYAVNGVKSIRRESPVRKRLVGSAATCSHFNSLTKLWVLQQLLSWESLGKQLASTNPNTTFLVGFWIVTPFPLLVGLFAHISREIPC